jgi:hypothetical protein
MGVGVAQVDIVLEGWGPGPVVDVGYLLQRTFYPFGQGYFRRIGFHLIVVN